MTWVIPQTKKQTHMLSPQGIVYVSQSTCFNFCFLRYPLSIPISFRVISLGQGQSYKCPRQCHWINPERYGKRRSVSTTGKRHKVRSVCTCLGSISVTLCSGVYLHWYQRKQQSSSSLAICVGNPRGESTVHRWIPLTKGQWWGMMYCINENKTNPAINT